MAKPKSLGLGLREPGLLPRNSIYIFNIRGRQLISIIYQELLNKEKASVSSRVEKDSEVSEEVEMTI